MKNQKLFSKITTIAACVLTAAFFTQITFAQTPAQSAAVTTFPTKSLLVAAATIAQKATLAQPTNLGQTVLTLQAAGTAATSVEAPTSCTFAAQTKPEYKAKFLAIKKPVNVQPGQLFNMQIFVQNTGNTPWFSEASGCNTNPLHLGTEEDRDRMSPFYTSDSNPDTGMSNTWNNANRIKMDNKRVSPLETASFTITAKAPTEPGVYREFYAPVVEGVTWIGDEGIFSIDINVGNASLDPNTAQYVTYIQKSANLSTLKLDGGKNILVDLSEQKMYVKIGDAVVRTFPVSTGAPGHPTPPGTFKIFLKQQVRVAGSAPHYIMPLFQEFKAGGYGIHALPSLGNDHGIFWREALNHIGSPRSHGCVRLLPKDAQYVWDFTEMGTPMTIRW